MNTMLYYYTRWKVLLSYFVILFWVWWVGITEQNIINTPKLYNFTPSSFFTVSYIVRIALTVMTYEHFKIMNFKKSA